MAVGEYVLFREGDQRRFIESALDLFGSKNVISCYLGVHRSMISRYLSEECKMSVGSVISLAGCCAIDMKRFGFSVVEFPDKGDASVPEWLSENLAEFVGIMLGDGHINLSNYQFTIACGAVDAEYITKHIPSLVSGLFSKEVHIKDFEGIYFHCVFSSKKVCEYLVDNIGMFGGRKLAVEIPDIFFKTVALLTGCVRGLFDTDGGLHRHHKHSAQLIFTNKCVSLVDSLKKALILLGYHPSLYHNKKRKIYSLYLFNADVRRYFLKIGSSNHKNNIKFLRWIETGVVPNNSELKRKNAATGN